MRLLPAGACRTVGVRNGVVAEAAPRMTAGDPAKREPQAARRAMNFHGVDGVGRTGRREAAGAAGKRRHSDLIGANERERDGISHAARPADLDVAAPDAC